MKNQMELPEELDGMVLIETLISPMQPNTGVIIVGDNYGETSIQPIVRIYLITWEDDDWVIEKELQAFAFSDMDSAKRFVSDLPHLSAIDILILMNGSQRITSSQPLFQ